MSALLTHAGAFYLGVMFTLGLVTMLRATKRGDRSEREYQNPAGPPPPPPRDVPPSTERWGG